MIRPGPHARGCFHYFSFEAVNSENILLKIDKIRLKASAHQNPSTLKPGTMLSTNKIIKALITSKKRPNVKMVMGIVNITRIGFTKILAREINNAAKRAYP